MKIGTLIAIVFFNKKGSSFVCTGLPKPSLKAIASVLLKASLPYKS
jgi:hypothetical protein